MRFEQRPPIETRTTNVLMVRTEDLDRTDTSIITRPSLTLFLYRVDFNKTMRAAWSGVGHVDGEAHLPVDLHFLLTPWAENAENEYRIIGRAMQCIENTPILSGPLLDPLTDWTPYDSIQLCLEDLSTEDVMRTFDSLPTDYKLSVPYVARVLVIDGGIAHQAADVSTVATGAKDTVDV